VNRYAKRFALVAVTTMTFAVPSFAADPGASDVPVGKDLAAVIALQGLPCGQVVSTSQQGENDYLVSCQDGNRYRVFVNADGRVVVEKK
jgi:hypothetical protein